MDRVGDGHLADPDPGVVGDDPPDSTQGRRRGPERTEVETRSRRISVTGLSSGCGGGAQAVSPPVPEYRHTDRLGYGGRPSPTASKRRI